MCKEPPKSDNVSLFRDSTEPLFAHIFTVIAFLWHHLSDDHSMEDNRHSIAKRAEGPGGQVQSPPSPRVFIFAKSEVLKRAKKVQFFKDTDPAIIRLVP